MPLPRRQRPSSEGGSAQATAAFSSLPHPSPVQGHVTGDYFMGSNVGPLHFYKGRLETAHQSEPGTSQESDGSSFSLQ